MSIGCSQPSTEPPSVEQLLAAGFTRRQLKRLEEAGAIVAGLRRTYRSPSVPFDELARCAMVCLANPDLTIAGPTAGRLWGFRRLPADQRIHVIAPPASNPAVARLGRSVSHRGDPRPATSSNATTASE